MAKYRGFVGQVAPLEGLGALRRTLLNGERTGYYSTNKITPYIAPTTEAAPILEPTKSVGYVFDPTTFDVAAWQQELEARQYAEGGDVPPATEIERTAKIDEAYKRILEASGYAKESERWEGVTGFYHPDDIASSIPISCMRTNPNIRTIMPMVCKPNQAAIDDMAARGLKTTLPLSAPKQEMPALLPLAIGAGLIWLMS